MPDVFALLDDCTATADEPRSRLYTGFVGLLSCDMAGQWQSLLEAMQQALADGRHAVGLFSYELGAQLQGVSHAPADWPLAQVLIFERCERLSADRVAHWLERQTEGSPPAGVAALRANVSEDEFAEAVGVIRGYIASGDTYQVNYTYRLRFDAYGEPLALYRRLRERQPVPFGACIALPDGRVVLSLSPELFLRHEGGLLTARPMKGTAPASGDAAIDAARARSLASDKKNRAENLMIVDLLRNDLGRIAALGSVQVPALYEVARHGGVLQMTSTITARLRDGVSLTDIFAAVYPCGSITGAPKRRTMQIIGEVEPAARGLYTGAIGWFGASEEGASVGDFCLSVPIRTLALQTSGNGVRRGEMGVGAGIVFDSQTADEWAECQLKAGFLTGLPPTFAIFETMRASPQGCPLLEKHLARLPASAAYFGLAFDEKAARTAVREACAGLAAGDYRLRLAFGPAGIDIRTAPLAPLPEPVRLLLADEPMSSDDLFLRHKTTVRDRYDAAWREAERQGAFDMLFVNEKGELTEGGRSNVFVKLDGRWFTPPLSAGLLPGVMRAVLLEDGAWGATERALMLADLRAAEEIVVCNALRGVLRATLVF